LLVAGHLTMAVEGKPATQTLTYAGHSYAVAAEGRMESRHVHLMVDAKPYEFGAAPDGGLAIKDLPTGASLPAELPKGSYVMAAKADLFGRTAFYFAVSLIIMG